MSFYTEYFGTMQGQPFVLMIPVFNFSYAYRISFFAFGIQKGCQLPEPGFAGFHQMSCRELF